MTPADIDQVLARILAQMNLDSETEREVLDEIRSHLEEAVAAARARGLDPAAALTEAAARFGVDEIGLKLQEAHAGWVTADAILAAGLPVVCTLVLRWLIFAPDGTALNWPQIITRPIVWLVAGVALVVPMLIFEDRRYALATWVFFWAITITSLVLPSLRW
jgi:hypothetical protein